MKKTSLGTGLSSLIPNKLNKENNAPLEKKKFSSSDEVIKIPTENIIPNPNQPRYYFDRDNLKELSESIKEHGIIQPILVTKIDNNKYELIAGERRLQATKLVGIKEIPAIVRLATNQEKLELALIENIQRHNLNPIEEAKAYKKLQTEFKLTQKEVAKKSGKSRSTIANLVRLLDLPIEIQRGIIEEKITEGHARAILGLENPEKQRALYELILRNNLTVRSTEDKVKEVTIHTHKRKIIKQADPYIQDLEDKIQQKLGTKVQIKKRGSSGKITIDFFSEEEFKKIIKILNC
ncbi:MAG: ParB/RepB/Spo0J family partition protein [Candidatus Andersenbacteria bacterium]|nr:ParB/RepB/Spo0J family partition protein [Candidatus Andersenbacteria bacterium]